MAVVAKTLGELREMERGGIEASWASELRVVMAGSVVQVWESEGPPQSTRGGLGDGPRSWR